MFTSISAGACCAGIAYGLALAWGATYLKWKWGL